MTLKGEKILQNAEVVLYDRLIGKGILSRIPANAEAIYVGKESGNHTIPQEAITAILMEKAARGKRVVRLKGGDPFLFGRGGEEVEDLKAAGIPFEIVPGVSSALAVPAYFGIPVTHRDCCSQVHIITGHGSASTERDKEHTIDYESLVKAGGTLIFLMGTAALDSICSNLLKAGLAPDTPGAVLEQGTTARQRKVLANLSRLPDEAKKAAVKSPAIIIIGEVCGFSDKFSWAESRPLAGLRIGVTRPRNRIGKLSDMLAAEGAEVVELPAIRTAPLGETPALEKLLSDLSGLPGLARREWLVFTSPTGVEVFFEKLKSNNRDSRTLAGLRFAAIGKATAAALEDRGILVDLVPEQFSGNALGIALRGAVKENERVILLRSKMGTDEVTKPLEEAKINFTDIPIYDTFPEAGRSAPEYLDIIREDLDWLIFTSASTVEGFVKLFGPERIKSLNAKGPKVEGPKVEGPKVEGPKVLCIGRQTAEAAEKHGMNTYTSKNATLESMVEKLKEVRGKS
jgi:uroporphyrinogen III methyltransferase/synthase